MLMGLNPYLSGFSPSGYRRTLSTGRETPFLSEWSMETRYAAAEIDCDREREKASCGWLAHIPILRGCVNTRRVYTITHSRAV